MMLFKWQNNCGWKQILAHKCLWKAILRNNPQHWCVHMCVCVWDVSLAWCVQGLSEHTLQTLYRRHMSLYSFPLFPLSFYECIILRNTVKIVTIKNYSNKEWTSCCDVSGLFWFKFILGQSKTWFIRCWWWSIYQPVLFSRDISVGIYYSR